MRRGPTGCPIFILLLLLLLLPPTPLGRQAGPTLGVPRPRFPSNRPFDYDPKRRSGVLFLSRRSIHVQKKNYVSRRVFVKGAAALGLGAPLVLPSSFARR